jgi:hypothetical protein
MNYPIQYRYFAVGLVVGVLLTLLYLSDNFHLIPMADSGLAWRINTRTGKVDVVGPNGQMVGKAANQPISPPNQ